ncbi:spatacsin isoform X1 [Bombus huntii]|uniref:spatacsin isoform X1 n=1 Tax=Bombus huntii TaxID=85661 RepID=UPI0021AA1F44|nr:spatacsin isoform X1 [Bombus huntii]XP_050480518.1 spatacsin isoform X1 [Bombus huntii]XP_050480519.1 spatacsin isoform X1 [Bombus huntii]XP_050480520.1 spatacsin isoform X1 [Bombus huntii]XP_050480521.1 spatacsin isoform X1 [Bombus huntii]XP_050480522.1 spatacsin isoform X1 [Bombus huntii]
MAEKTIVGGIPIECLTGEPAIIWSGWRILGDRELVREASAKGTHINLAYKCLAYRRRCSIEDAQHYFNKEVETWIIELLKKHQIYRASHILNNMDKNPMEYIFKVCVNCKDFTLRNYLSEYLISVAHFENKYIDSWNIIKSIVEFEQKYMVEDGLSSSLCIEDIIKLPEDIKQALCTELYFSITEQSLLKNVTNIVLWDYLLSNNKIELMRFWIDIYYGNDTIEEINEINEEYKSLFRTLDIVPDMIEAIDSSDASTLIKDLAKNHLCRYGVFVEREQRDVKLLLARIFASAMTIAEFNTILSYKSCNINKTEFMKKIDKELCLAHCLSETSTQEDETKIIELYDVLTKMCENQEPLQDILTEGIFKTIYYLSDDVTEYLKQNYLIVLVLIFSYQSRESAICNQDKGTVLKKITLKSIFTSKNPLQLCNYDISNEVLQNTLKQVPILESIIKKEPKNKVTMYELLDGYKNLNVKQLYKWRFNNEPMPHFSNETLVKKYGYTEDLTYKYYLKEARPNMAIFSLKHSQGKLIGNVSSRRKYKAALYAHSLALRNLEKPEILHTCISFMEILGIDSENLRLHITVANYIYKQINIPIGNLLENIIYKNENDLKTVMSYLESSFQTSCTESSINDSQEFVNVLKIWDVIVRFAAAHNFAFPISFLKFLASKNHWFEFVLVCHIFNYPLNQILENIEHFENTILREHLLTCLSNIQLTKSQLAVCNEQKIKSRDVRQSLYYKIGVKQSVSPNYDSPVSADLASTYDSHSINEYTVNDNICSPNDDLWLIILKCLQSPDPPGALINSSRLTSKPFLIVLASCYEPSSIAAYCYSWMVISTTDKEILSNYEECLKQQVWTANQVYNLLDQMVTYGYITIVSKAYKIFMPESLFNLFFDFLIECVIYGDFKSCQQKLLDFKAQCVDLKCNEAIDWNCSDTTYLNNLYWIAIVTIKCLIATLAYGLRSTHLQIKFLEILIKCNFYKNFPDFVPIFPFLLQVIKILQKTNVALNFAAFTVSDNVYNFDTEIHRCINDLIRTEDYTNALKLSNVAGFNSSEIILAQCRSKFKYYIQKNEKIEDNFWNECALNFKKYNISYEKAAEFFVEHAEKVTSHKERYEILKLAFETLKNIETEQQDIDVLETAMWKSCMLAGPENVQLDDGPYIFNKLKTELLSGLNELKFGYTLSNIQEKNAIESLINTLIDLGKLDTALRISTIFNYKHKDLQILMLCLSLAEGEISPNDLNIEQQSLLKEVNKNKQQKYNALKNRGLQRFSSASSLITSISTEMNKLKHEDVHGIQMECLSILEKLFNILEHGVDICLRIVLCYKLAMQLEKSYQFLLMLNNPIEFLQEITESDSIKNKSEIINDIVIAYKINNDDVATFLAENITLNINRAVEDGYENNVCLWGYSLNTNFRVIMELCNDVSLLGWKLLKTANKLLGHSHGEKTSAFILKTIAELLIRAHDCFTTSCNMEGIASVLCKCQIFANVLQNLKYWTLLVRLVTGVGRFTEMNYVFQILKENDQFEFLLGKGLNKVIGLETAILEFLKRHCPENKELFTLVALHFRLYHELAHMWKNEAEDIINTIISDATKDLMKLQSTVQHEKKFIKTENILKQLHLAVTNYTHATEYYLQANKLNLANQCSDQVQLVALQLSLFNTVSYNQQVICILNLKPGDIDKVLCHNLSFSQAFVVIHAYNHHVDWANLIYSHCILNGETKYLKDFIAVNKLTPSLVRNCVRRYRLEKSITHTMTDNMKILISELSDVECKYVLASQLGFKGIVETMLNNPMIGAYLKDTVWKKGYNAI